MLVMVAVRHRYVDDGGGGVGGDGGVGGGVGGGGEVFRSKSLLSASMFRLIVF